MIPRISQGDVENASRAKKFIEGSYEVTET